jgi:processing peptidase subunit beta
LASCRFCSFASLILSASFCASLRFSLWAFLSAAAASSRAARHAARVPSLLAGARSYSVPSQHPNHVSTLPNQLRIASEASGGDTATVGVWIDTGSRYETDENNGVAHFLEHMAFKGTSKRTQLQLETEVENMGAHLNAYTSREQTVYYAKCLKKDVPHMVEMLSDILLNSSFNASSVERERDVIMREMQEVESQIEEVVFDRLHEVAYVGTPLARTILGPEENIRSISVDDIQRYVKTNYPAPRMVVAAAGAVDHGELVNAVGEHFGGVQESAPPGYEFEDTPSLFTGADVRDYDDDMPMAHFALAFEGLSWTHPDIFTLMLCQTLLGFLEPRNAYSATMSAAPLSANLAKAGLASTMQPFCTCYKDTGLFGVYFVSDTRDKERAYDLFHHVQEELVAITTGCSDEDVARGKAQLKFQLLQQMDGTSPTCEEIGRQILTYGRRMSLAETFARIDAIDASDVERVADAIIWDQEVAFAAVGSGLKNVYDMTAMRRGTFWNRL